MSMTYCALMTKRKDYMTMLELLAYLLEPAIWALAFIACLFVIATFAGTSEISR